MRHYLRNLVLILALTGIAPHIQAQSLAFDGLDDYVTIPDLNGDFDFGQAFTVEAWVKPYSISSSGTYRGIVRGAFEQFPPVGAGGWVMSTRLFGNVTLSVCTPSCEAATAGPMQPNVWNHLAGVYDGASIKFYINGIPGGQTPWQGDVTDINFVLIGIWETSFPGLIDEVRIWNVARTQEQILGAMFRPLNGDEPGLVGYWRFNEGSGQTVVDSSTRANHGHLGRETSFDSYDPQWCASDVFHLRSPAATVLVPGTSDPWLAGMPDGARASLGDIAPDHSPSRVLGIPIIPRTALTFTASGAVSYHPTTPLDGPDGNASSLTGHFPGFPAAENGIANCIAPADALVGVFLGPDLPTLTPAPKWLDFSTPESRAYGTLAPLLKQVFFIGDGHTADGTLQQVLVPSEARRLFLGTMDGSGWYNNMGSFTVQVSSPDLPQISVRLFSSKLEISWNSVSNAIYRVEYCSDLSTNNWVSLQDGVQSGGTATFVTDMNLPGKAQRFYRVVRTH